MVPQRRPPTSSPPTRERETFTWPPTTDELDALEVIVLDDSPPARHTHPPTHPRPHTFDLAHWGLTLVSLAAIVVALVLQFTNWRGPTGSGVPPGDASSTLVSAASTTAAMPTLSAHPVEAVASSPRAVQQPARAFVPVRKPRARERDSRAAIDSPPLRLPESYVQPRLVSSNEGGRVRGTVILGVQVRANGRVGDVDVLSENGDGDRNLERAAVAAVKQWRYRPALRDGLPTPARLKVIVKFS